MAVITPVDKTATEGRQPRRSRHRPLVLNAVAVVAGIAAWDVVAALGLV
ncbi:hypothetical protein GCM10010277_13500 [Streptomyces longisporoflavus]|nr:hypothetical protein GCM10010277_13500 [Streptomyces longisporoflavus]